MTIHIFYHGADLDGHASGAIARDALCDKDVMMYPIDYGQPFPWELINPDDTVYMLDYSIPELWKLYDLVGGKLIWIDHHVSAIQKYLVEYVERENGKSVPGKRLIGKGACELTWEYFYPGEEVPEVIMLLSQYDVWDKSDEGRWNDVILPFQMGFRTLDTDPVSDPEVWEFIFRDVIASGRCAEFIDNVVEDGDVIILFQKAVNVVLMQSHGFEFLWEGLRCVAVNVPRASSQIFDSVYDPDLHDLMVAFSYHGRDKLWTVSLYSETVDCSEIAKKYGGGGHKGAAGFPCETLPWM
jgi:oligoribonuclease NrnB/cAMP/cGMP phosphodiesterase (DHH superfamily)